MSASRPRLGEALIEAKLLEPKQLDAALALQQKRQLRLGTILLQEGFIAEPQLVQALSHQLSVPWVSLWHIDIPDELLKKVPVNLAEEFFLIPIYIRATGDGERALYVAMNDPTDETALRFVAAAAGMPVKPMIAGPSDIAEAIRVYYYGEEDEEKPVADSCPPRMSSIPPPPGSNRPVPKASRGQPVERPKVAAHYQSDTGSDIPYLSDDAVQSLSDDDIRSLETDPPKQLARDTDPAIPMLDLDDDLQEDDAEDLDLEEDDEEPTVVSGMPTKPAEDRTSYPTRQEVEKHMFGVGRANKGGGLGGFSMTLLDGTMVSFGGARQKTSKPDEVYTKEDMVKALRAMAFGTPMDGLLPADRWENYMAALLEVLFKKHLVLFDEFLDALKKE